MTLSKFELFENNKKIVGSIIFRHFKMFIREYGDDLFSQGYILLLESIDRFDESKGFKLSTFAYKTIYYGLQAYLDEKLQGFKRRSKKVNGKWTWEVIKPQFSSFDNLMIDTNSDSKRFDDLYNFTEDENQKVDDEYYILYKDLECYISNIEKENCKNCKRSVYRGITQIYNLLLQENLTYGKICAITGFRDTAVRRKIGIIRDITRDYLGE